MSYAATTTQRQECVMPQCNEYITVSDYYSIHTPQKNYKFPVVCGSHFMCWKCGGFCPRYNWNNCKLTEFQQHFLPACKDTPECTTICLCSGKNHENIVKKTSRCPAMFSCSSMSAKDENITDSYIVGCIEKN